MNGRVESQLCKIIKIFKAKTDQGTGNNRFVRIRIWDTVKRQAISINAFCDFLNFRFRNMTCKNDCDFFGGREYSLQELANLRIRHNKASQKIASVAGGAA